MKATKAASVEQYKIAGRFDRIRDTLLEDRYTVHRQKPLAYWALPTDRRLPLVFLGQTIDSLLTRSFSELIATPGIGKKKILSFLKLLSRAAATPAEEIAPEPFPADLPETDGQLVEFGENLDQFDPDRITEVAWSRWRTAITRHRFENDTLGRLAASLKQLPRSSWQAPLKQYTQFSLAEIRSMRTHGEKRVRAILEVFYDLHQLVGQMKPAPHLVVRIVPERIEKVRQWVDATLESKSLPSDEEIYDNFTGPLLEQLQVDGVEQLEQLARQRLGLEGSIVPVRRIAKLNDLTRARVYQLLNEISDIMAVRWPEGSSRVDQLCVQLQEAAISSTASFDLVRFRAAVDLFFPAARTDLDDSFPDDLTETV
jgi:hypothetical protein